MFYFPLWFSRVSESLPQSFEQSTWLAKLKSALIPRAPAWKIRGLASASLSLILFVTSPVTAEVIVGYEALNSPDESAVSDVMENVMALELSRGLGLMPGSGSTFNSAGWNEESNDYLEWGWSSSDPLDLTDLDLRYDRSNSGPAEIEISLAVNDGDFESIFVDADVSVAGEDNLDIDLSAFSNVTSATFRLFGAHAEAFTGTLDIEPITAVSPPRGIVVNGITAVPEPEGLTLLLIASLSGVFLIAEVRKRSSIPRAV